MLCPVHSSERGRRSFRFHHRDVGSTVNKDQDMCQAKEEHAGVCQTLQASWQLLGAHEANLQPGQLLLPGLQQQLMQALGVTAGGSFGWLQLE